MPGKSESTPLLGASPENKGYYFLGREGGTTASVVDGDRGMVVEGIPEGATADEFAPRALTPKPKERKVAAATPTTPRRTVTPSTAQSGGFFSKLFGRSKNQNGSSAPVKILKPRKAPVKVEPKVFFANERTFLAWLHISIILAGGSIAILAFADEENPGSQLYGIILLPVAIAFIVYAMHQYTRRAYMIRNKHPGPYEDTVGPTVLGVLLMLSIVAQFAIKLYSISS